MSGIIRTIKSKEYFYASNRPFNDENLSWEARGVMGYLLSKPDGWECRNNDLIAKGPAGEHKIKRILKELKTQGYIRRIKTRNKDGTYDWITEVYESPELNPSKLKGDVDFDDLEGVNNLPEGKPTKDDLTEADVILGARTPDRGDERIRVAESSLLQSGWDIKDPGLRHSMVYFLAFTPFDVPNSDKAKRGYLKAIREHYKEYGYERLFYLYQEATKRLFPKVKRNGYIPPSGPWGYTKTLSSIVAQGKAEKEHERSGSGQKSFGFDSVQQEKSQAIKKKLAQKQG